MNNVTIESLDSWKYLNESKHLTQFKKLEKSFNVNVKSLNLIAKDYNINVNSIESKTMSIANKYKSKIKAGQKVRNDVAKKFADELFKLVVKPHVKKAVDDSFKGKINELVDSKGAEYVRKIIISIILTVCIVALSRGFDALLFPVLGPGAFVFRIVFLSPIIEETMKRIAVKGKYPYIFTGIFASWEALMYILVWQPEKAGIVAQRIAGIAFHFMLTWHQKQLEDDPHFFDRDMLDVKKLDQWKKDNPNSIWSKLTPQVVTKHTSFALGYLPAIFAHTMSNFSVLLKEVGWGGYQ